MRSFYARGVALALALVGLTSMAEAQDVGFPSLLPLPPLPQGYAVAQTTATDATWYQGEPSPAPVVRTGDQSVISPDYVEAMKGNYDGGCTACNAGCCPHNHYVYANALVMSHVKQGGFVPSVDSATGSAALFFCQTEFGNLWHGGFEVGTGWCFGSDCRQALEVVYWGLYPATATATARGSLNSTIDFSDLDLNGGNANLLVINAQVQQVQYGFNFNSVEVNLVGNGCCGGPFGCGMCGCCSGRGGSPWGMGFVAGFRYINFNENWLFRSDTTDGDFNGDPTELNYRMQLDNNLFGFQIGGGISYCVTDSLTAYATAKFGVYNNHVNQSQRVYGPGGNAVLNNGPYNGYEFDLNSTDDVFATSGQFDLGGRYAINNNWSVNFGYRVMGLAGVAISETNAVHQQFQNADGIASQQTTGSFILHGGYVGATYCW